MILELAADDDDDDDDDNDDDTFLGTIQSLVNPVN